MPAELEAALRDAVQLLPGIQAHLETPNSLGEKGTAYSLPDFEGRLLMVIFDEDGHFIGAPELAVVQRFRTRTRRAAVPPDRLTAGVLVRLATTRRSHHPSAGGHARRSPPK